MRSAVIVDAVRTAGGKRNGKLSGWHPADLAAETLKALVERTGIVERHIAGENETTCTMAADAAREAMARAGIGPGEIDCIVLSTATPDRLLPSTAVDLQAELGATRASAFDISAACTGWIYGMAVAEGLAGLALIP